MDWRVFARETQGLGVGRLMGFLPHPDDEDLGALNLYSQRPGFLHGRRRDSRPASGAARLLPGEEHQAPRGRPSGPRGGPPDLTAPPAHILNWGNLTGSAPQGSVTNPAC
ncbi:hypothetical protein GCM10010228_14800 [Streptomyces massasporeus]|nr:hypothetical protein GCM10010228_14800 [Streptomyces massasporeus]